MSAKTKKTPAAKPVATPKAPKKLVPRTAPKAEVKPAEVVAEPIVAPAAKVAAAKPAPVVTEKPAAVAPAASKAKVERKPTQVEVTVAKHQKVLAEALVKAQAIKYDQPKVMKQEATKAAKAKKVKLVRDSYAMPDNAQIGVLKKRLSGLGSDVKKSELLRGGIAVLAALSDAELKAAMGRVERIKTGRPAK